mmetsp:Transcript_29107/g.76242  ORF Transcript_29107/g.76242 Transcript_29107/m.76242 type:complete len:252 (-) Transcript_29107:128-883(-)
MVLTRCSQDAPTASTFAATRDWRTLTLPHRVGPPLCRVITATLTGVQTATAAASCAPPSTGCHGTTPESTGPASPAPASQTAPWRPTCGTMGTHSSTSPAPRRRKSHAGLDRSQLPVAGWDGPSSRRSGGGVASCSTTLTRKPVSAMCLRKVTQILATLANSPGFPHMPSSQLLHVRLASRLRRHYHLRVRRLPPRAPKSACRSATLWKTRGAMQTATTSHPFVPRRCAPARLSQLGLLRKYERSSRIFHL